MSKLKTEKWEKRFDEEFAVDHQSWGDDFHWADNIDAKASDIKQFISTLLKEQKEEYLEKGEEIKEKENDVAGMAPHSPEYDAEHERRIELISNYQNKIRE